MTSRPKIARDLLMALRIGAEPGAGEDDVADEQDVALALVDVLGHAHIETVGPEPVHVGRALGLPLRVGEARAVGDVVEHEAAVGRVDHVGQALDGVDQLHVEAEVEVGLVQRLPLADRERVVGGVFRVHLRIDPVAHREVLRPAHQHRARCGLANRRIRLGVNQCVRHLTFFRLVVTAAPRRRRLASGGPRSLVRAPIHETPLPVSHADIQRFPPKSAGKRWSGRVRAQQNGNIRVSAA